MKFRIPFVVVTVVDLATKAVHDVCFVDTPRRRPCIELCREAGYKVLDTKGGAYENSLSYEDATAEVLFTDTVASTGADMAWDDNGKGIQPFVTVEKGENNDG